MVHTMKMKHTLFITIISIVGMLSNVFAQGNIQIGLPDAAIALFGKGGINTIHFSPDGTQLAVGTSIGVWIYNVQDRKEKSLYPGHHDEIHTLAFSPDGKYLAVYGFQNAIIQLWDMNSDLNEPILTFPEKPGRITKLVFGHDNNKLFGISELGFLAEWDIETGNRLSTQRYGKRGLVTAFNPKGQTLACGDPDNNEISLWDSANDSLGEVFKEKLNPNAGNTLSRILGGNQNNRKGPTGIETLALSPDSKTIASSHIGNIIKIWDVTTREERFSLKGHKEIISTFSFSPDSPILASGSTDNTIKIWDVSNGQPITTLTGHKNSIETLAFSPTEATLLASGSTDGTVRFWDTKTGKERSVFATGHTESIEAVAFNTTDTMISSVAANGTVQIWDIQTGKKLPSPSVPHYDSNSALVLSQDATLLAINGQDNNVRSRVSGLTMQTRSHRETRLLSLPTGDELKSFPHPSEYLALSPDNNILAAVNPREQVVQLWDINTGDKLFSFGIELSLHEKIIFSHDGQYLAIYGYNDQTQLWHVPTQEKIDIPNVKEISVIAFSPDNKTMAVEHPNVDGLRVIGLWKITQTGIEKHKEIIPEFRNGYTAKLLFSPDSKTLIQLHKSGWRSYIILWDIDTGVELDIVSGHIKNIQSIVFSHDGKTLASGSEDGTILLWDWEKIMMKIGKQ
ncbi:WD40 repeat domain-containing protein [Candidatus Poribacteria bacterium]|nr:WD40 repeat domain-containing protein [Candidatus Poribacteria bacterium]